MVPETGLIALFVRPLNELRLPYLITGGVASIVYGEPRFTRDIDLVVDLPPLDSAGFIAHWPTDQFYVPPLEVVEEEGRRPVDGHFNIVHHQTGLKADVYLVGDDDLMTWAMAQPRLQRIGPDEIRLAPIEYVAIQKLRYAKAAESDRHLEDIARMLRISGSLVHAPTIDEWITRFQLEREWGRALALSR